MQLTHTFAMMALMMLPNLLASAQGLGSDTDMAFKARDVLTATWKDSKLEARMNESQDDHVDAQKRFLGADPYTVPYPQQTGPTRYAPLAKKPGTAIATTAPTPQFPASPYTIATEYLEPGTVKTTLTASETLSVTMIENTVCCWRDLGSCPPICDI